MNFSTKTILCLTVLLFATSESTGQEWVPLGDGMMNSVSAFPATGYSDGYTDGYGYADGYATHGAYQPVAAPACHYGGNQNYYHAQPECPGCETPRFTSGIPTYNYGDACSVCGGAGQHPSLDQPFGSSLRAAMSHQVRNGIAAQLALYHTDFDFHPPTNSWQLSDSGVRRLNKIACLIPSSSCPVVVQTTNNAGGDEMRRQKVIEWLGYRGTPVDPQRVVVGNPRAAGLSAAEATQIYARSLNPQQLQDQQTQNSDGLGFQGINTPETGNTPSP